MRKGIIFVVLVLGKIGRVIGRVNALKVREKVVSAVPAAQSLSRSVARCIVKIRIFRVATHKAVYLPLPLGVGGTCAEVRRNLNITAANLFCKVKLYITAGLVYRRKYRTPYAYIGVIPPAAWVFHTGNALVGKRSHRRIYGIVVGERTRNNLQMCNVHSVRKLSVRLRRHTVAQVPHLPFGVLQSLGQQLR